MKKLIFSLSAIALLFTTGVYASNTAHDTMMSIKSQKEILQGIPMKVVNPFSVVLQFGDSFAAGVIDRQSGHIFIANNQPYWALKHIMLHESGHFIFDRTPEALQWQYCRAFQVNGLSPSRYGKLDCDENFAEYFAFVNGSRYGMYSDIDFYFQNSSQERLMNAIIDIWNYNKTLHQ